MVSDRRAQSTRPAHRFQQTDNRQMVDAAAVQCLRTQENSALFLCTQQSHWQMQHHIGKVDVVPNSLFAASLSNYADKYLQMKNGKYKKKNFSFRLATQMKT